MLATQMLRSSRSPVRPSVRVATRVTCRGHPSHAPHEPALQSSGSKGHRGVMEDPVVSIGRRDPRAATATVDSR